ncbi:MAG TPA: biotin--[acetyl-CoA-carboxylase] ligase [Ferruginibacter sp.]|nr:biotin--[acetyl-CoA-carboxylase] ligase [Ferruginibacter sp.]
MLKDSFFKILDTVDSTNNYAMGRVHAGMASHGMVWFAQEQTAGKGQRGKGWQTEPGKNIAMSLVLQPEKLNASQQFLLSAAVALACFEFFAGYAGDETKIKWPNDLYWRDRKAGGVLIENVFHGKQWKWAIAGIGININQTDFDGSLQNPVSLKQITGKEFNTVDLAKELYARLMKNIEEINAEAPEELLNNYNRNIYKLNKTVKLKKENTSFETVISGVSPQGRLLTVDATDRQFDFGEVEWVI